MKKLFLIVVGILILFSCNHNSNLKKLNLNNVKDENVTINTSKKSAKNINLLKKKMIGIWTSEGSINANFKISEKTFYYVDDFADYNYSLTGNTLRIYYPDYIYEGKISFKNDTLILSNENREVKYWRFKE